MGAAAAAGHVLLNGSFVSDDKIVSTAAGAPRAEDADREEAGESAKAENRDSMQVNSGWWLHPKFAGVDVDRVAASGEANRQLVKVTFGAADLAVAPREEGEVHPGSVNAGLFEEEL